MTYDPIRLTVEDARDIRNFCRMSLERLIQWAGGQIIQAAKIGKGHVNLTRYSTDASEENIRKLVEHLTTQGFEATHKVDRLSDGEKKHEIRVRW